MLRWPVDPVRALATRTLPQPGRTPFAYEMKWDGIRAVAYTGPTGLTLVSRNDRDISAAYPDLADLPSATGGRRLVLDGEIVAMDDSDRPSFSRLQQRMHVRTPTTELITSVPVIYQVFDVLMLDGATVMQEPYQRRRDLLAGLSLAGATVRVPPHFTDTDSQPIVAAAQAYGLEGVMAKRIGSTYQPGRRSRDWIKAPFTPTQEVVIVGYKPGEGRRAGTIGSLLMAVERGATLSFAGGVGTGFTDATLADLKRRLQPLTRPKPALSDVPRLHARGVIWVDPVLVGEVAYRNWTPDGRLRHPSWRGLRPDKTPAQTTPATSPAPVPQETVEATMQTPDGQWRVEIVRRGDSRWYRIVHADELIDWLSIAAVERILDTAGVDRATLGPPRQQPTQRPRRSATG